MSNEALYYLHGVIPSGVTGWEGDGLFPGTAVRRLDGGRFCALATDLAAAGLTVEAVQDVMEDPVRSMDYVIAHQTVLSRIHQDTRSVLPMRFCTLYRDAGKVRAFLKAEETALDAAISQISGCTEWGVKLIEDQKAPTPVEPEADDTQDADMTPGKRFLLTRKRQRTGVERRREAFAARLEDVQKTLEGASRDIVCHALRPVENGETPVSRMLWNASCLVADRKSDVFETLVETLSHRLKETGWRIDITGPWPPYSFATVMGEPAMRTET